MDDPMLFINTAFDRGGKIILEISSELEELRVKFGDGSQIVKKKNLQLSRLVEFHDNMRGFVDKLVDDRNAYENALKLSEVNCKAYELIVMSLQSGVHTDRLIKLMKPNE